MSLCRTFAILAPAAGAAPFPACGSQRPAVTNFDPPGYPANEHQFGGCDRWLLRGWCQRSTRLCPYAGWWLHRHRSTGRHSHLRLGHQRRGIGSRPISRQCRLSLFPAHPGRHFHGVRSATSRRGLRCNWHQQEEYDCRLRVWRRQAVAWFPAQRRRRYPAFQRRHHRYGRHQRCGRHRRLHWPRAREVELCAVQRRGVHDL